MLRVVTFIFFTVVVTLFGLANLHIVSLKTVFADEVRASLAFLLLGAFAFGFTVSTITSMFQNLKSRRRERARLVRQYEEVRPLQLPPPPQILAHLDGQRRGYRR